ncbi:hypothetical protein KIPB_016381, partial [Kipferlia bialata]
SFSERYLYDGHLGDGSYGDVWRIKEKEGECRGYAAKFMDLTGPLREDLVKHIPRELSVLKKIQSPYVVGYVEHFINTDDTFNNHMVIVMELLEGGWYTIV